MADDNITPLASLSLTHVYYNPDDPLSYLGAFLSLLPQALCVVYATLFWSTREAEVLLMFLGQLACEALNFVLKRLIKEERPTTLPSGPAGKGYGMPSSHAQFAVFWAVAASLFLLVRHRPERGLATNPRGNNNSSSSNNASASSAPVPAPALADVPRAYRTGGLPAASASIEAYAHGPWTLPQRALASAGALVVAGLVAWSRVYLGYHTVRQVAAGGAAGAGCAAAWFAVTYLMRETGALAWALELPPARWLRVRDLVVEEDPCQAGWEKWEARREVVKQRERERGKGKGKGKGGKGL